MAKITDEFGNVVGEIKADDNGGCMWNFIYPIIIILILLVAINCCNPNPTNVTESTNSSTTNTTNHHDNLSSSSNSSSDFVSSSQTQLKDISNLNTVSGKINKSINKISYTFTPEVDGRYIFYLDNYSGKLKTSFRLCKSNGSTVESHSQYVYDNGKLYDNLKKGEKYTLTIEHISGDSNFSLIINKQAPTKSISTTTLSDSFTFSRQINHYTFIAPSDGQYVFSVDIPGKHNCKLTLRDSSENKLDTTYNSNSVAGELKAGKTYKFDIQQSIYLGSYSVSVKKRN